jgi:hypothetical protein
MTNLTAGKESKHKKIKSKKGTYVLVEQQISEKRKANTSVLKGKGQEIKMSDKRYSWMVGS